MRHQSINREPCWLPFQPIPYTLYHPIDPSKPLLAPGTLGRARVNHTCRPHAHLELLGGFQHTDFDQRVHLRVCALAHAPAVVCARLAVHRRVDGGPVAENNLRFPKQ